MSSTSRARVIFFEPWSLGDVIIAAATLRELSEPVTLACHSSWHSILRAALTEIPNLDLISADLPYTTRTRSSPFDCNSPLTVGPSYKDSRVLSIRGDFRDWMAARRRFPQATIRMNGWARFFARKSAIVNFPYLKGLLPVANRYHSWAELGGVTYEKIESTYRRLQAQIEVNDRLILHVGAQWRSKQFPDVASLRDALRDQGFEVRILAGPGDQLPSGLVEAEVLRVADESLVKEFRSASQAITNDSGPMHVGAFLGCRTTVLVRASPIEEWTPPLVEVLAAVDAPKGYRPTKNYMSDNPLTGWPAIQTIVESVTRRRSANA